MCGKIYTRTYHDFKIDKIYFKGGSKFTTGNETRRTCSDLLERQYKHLIYFLFPCVSSNISDIVSIYWGSLQYSITFILIMKYIAIHIKKGVSQLQYVHRTEKLAIGIIIIHSQKLLKYEVIDYMKNIT